MSNTYTDQLNLRMPAPGDLQWDDEINDNSEILEVILVAQFKGSRIASGLAPSDGGGLQVDYAEGDAEVNGTIYNISAGNKSCTAQVKNWLYVNDSGTVVISVNPPTGQYAPIAMIDAGATTIMQIADLRNLSGKTVSTFMKAILDDANLAAMLTSMGIASFLRSMLQSTTSADAVSNLGILGLLNQWTQSQNYSSTNLSIVTGNVAISFEDNPCAYLPLTENAVISAPTGLGPNRAIFMRAKQDGTGGRTLSHNAAIVFAYDSAVNTNADAETWYLYWTDNTSVYGLKIWETP